MDTIYATYMDTLYGSERTDEIMRFNAFQVGKIWPPYARTPRAPIHSPLGPNGLIKKK